MTAGDGEHADADLHAWTEDNAAFHSLFNSGVCASRIAHACYACFDCPFHVVHSVEEAHREGSHDIPSDVYALQHEVDVGVDEARQDGPTPCVDLGDRIVGQTDALRGSNGLN